MTTAAEAITEWMTHAVTVERWAGHGAAGPLYDAPVALFAFVDPTTTQVRSATGETVLSSAGVFLPHDTSMIPVGSKVALPAEVGGGDGVVLTVAVHHSGMGTPDHMELRLG